MAILTDFELIRPRFESKQSDILDWLANAHARTSNIDASRLRKLIERYGCGPERIGFRGSMLEDFTQKDASRMQLFGSECDQGMGARTRLYSEFVEPILDRFYPTTRTEPPPSDLIHVTCTGYTSPSAAQKLVSRRGWGTQTRVTHLYHMGCYASFPGIRTAIGFLASSSSSIDIVHTELCSLHFNPSRGDPEQLVIQSLFADGSVRYSVRAEGRGLKVIVLREDLIPESEATMAWSCDDSGMKMVLARDVPEKICTALPGFLSRMARDAKMDYERLLKGAIFAVHPGGPRILDRIQDLMKLSDDQLKASRDTLFRYGNMSSATLPHLWSNLISEKTCSEGQLVVSIAFGPGLTISGAVFEMV